MTEKIDVVTTLVDLYIAKTSTSTKKGAKI